mgnify:CR=1 FL=1
MTAAREALRALNDTVASQQRQIAAMTAEKAMAAGMLKGIRKGISCIILYHDVWQ